jgi:hypothetical protein
VSAPTGGQLGVRDHATRTFLSPRGTGSPGGGAERRQFTTPVMTGAHALLDVPVEPTMRLSALALVLAAALPVAPLQATEPVRTDDPARASAPQSPAPKPASKNAFGQAMAELARGLRNVRPAEPADGARPASPPAPAATAANAPAPVPRPSASGG